jgi:GDP-D-mannose dehydratase
VKPLHGIRFRPGAKHAERAEDCVIATNEDHPVRECVKGAFDKAGLGDWENYVELDPSLLRSAEVDHLIGNYAKAERVARSWIGDPATVMSAGCCASAACT